MNSSIVSDGFIDTGLTWSIESDAISKTDSYHHVIFTYILLIIKSKIKQKTEHKIIKQN